MIRLLFQIMFSLTHATQRRIGKIAGWIIFAVLRIRRGVVDQQMQFCFPEWDAGKRKTVALAAYQNMVTTVAEAGLMAQLSREGQRKALPPWASHDGFEHIQNATRAGKGAIIVTAHLGNWDLLGTIYATLGIKLNIVARDIGNPRVNELWVELRQRSGLKQINAKRRSGGLKRILQALKANESIALVLDQNMAADKGVFVNFFGRPACTLDLAAVLAKRTSAPVIAAFMIRQPDGTHHTHIFPPLQWIEGDNDIVLNTQHYTSLIEAMVRRYPEQWLWLHRRWKTQPT